ncbi:cysteine-rich repeat secretory protein 38-like protein [Tanacetum coccineum]|uniref:Cysteine-rich repeat secretory protein 38-like protein n=1 Tax=Tanacetum coccineum TaxID=301880 RepID=A0ABQ4XN73_9ASTR
MLPTGTYAFKRVSHPLSPKEGVFDNDSDEEEVLDMVSVTCVGDGSDQVYGLGWYRADVSPEACSDCLSGFINTSLRDCLESKDMAIWTSLCNLSQPLVFETGAINVGENGGAGRYGLGQCSRDLSKSECENSPNSTLSQTLNPTLTLTPNLGLTPTPGTSGSGERWYKGDVILTLVAFLVFIIFEPKEIHVFS